MFVYEKKLQYPVKIKNTNPRLAAAGRMGNWARPCVT